MAAPQRSLAGKCVTAASRQQGERAPPGEEQICSTEIRLIFAAASSMASGHILEHRGTTGRSSAHYPSVSPNVGTTALARSTKSRIAS